jgi:hypothetical protein
MRSLKLCLTLGIIAVGCTMLNCVESPPPPANVPSTTTSADAGVQSKYPPPPSPGVSGGTNGVTEN